MPPVSASPCAEINSSKGNVVSKLAEIDNENRKGHVLDLESDFVVSKYLIDVEEGKNALMGDSEVHGGNKDIKMLDLGKGIDVSKSVNELDVGNDLVDGCREIGSIEEDKIASLDCKGPNLTDIEGGRVVTFVATEAYACSKLDLLKENAAEFVSSDYTASGNVVGLTIHGEDKVTEDSSNVSSRTVTETGGDCLDVNKDFDGDESKASLEGTQSDFNNDRNNGDDHDHNADNLVLRQCGSIDRVILPESQKSRAFGLERSTECAGIDSIKACTCSFCTKAAYIWLDLNYQDIKARASAMKKSQKGASILAERSITGKVTENNAAESLTRASKLESDLMHQWSSFFQHMADLWDEVGNELEARLSPLADLREKCKTDMELINATRSENR